MPPPGSVSARASTTGGWRRPDGRWHGPGAAAGHAVNITSRSQAAATAWSTAQGSTAAGPAPASPGSAARSWRPRSRTVVSRSTLTTKPSPSTRRRGISRRLLGGGRPLAVDGTSSGRPGCAWRDQPSPQRTHTICIRSARGRDFLNEQKTGAAGQGWAVCGVARRCPRPRKATRHLPVRGNRPVGSGGHPAAAGTAGSRPGAEQWRLGLWRSFRSSSSAPPTSSRPARSTNSGGSHQG